MELALLRVFQKELVFQAECALNAATVVNSGLKEQNSAIVFSGIQNLFSAAANMSRLFWGSPDSTDVVADRQALRDSVGLTETSVLSRIRTRNMFERFDEHLDRWWTASKAHQCVDMTIGTTASFEGVDAVDLFRAFDPRNARLALWGESFDVQEIISEIHQLYAKLRDEAAKPVS